MNDGKAKRQWAYILLLLAGSGAIYILARLGFFDGLPAKLQTATILSGFGFAIGALWILVERTFALVNQIRSRKR